jgi:hypothetical protein
MIREFREFFSFEVPSGAGLEGALSLSKDEKGFSQAEPRQNYEASSMKRVEGT